tara:strand:- start:12934 stop:13446 length:513 start_codon:yes stop_codon:yes gene_type:complete
MPSIRTTVKVKMDTKGFKKFSSAFKKQKDATVKVGHFGSKTHGEGPETIAGVSLINQQGNSKIPARPYMEYALSNPEFLKAYKKALARIAVGKSTITKELPKLGEMLKEIMVRVIQLAGPGFQRNSAATIASKGVDTPLIETSELMADIESKLVRDTGNKRRTGLNTVAQ